MPVMAAARLPGRVGDRLLAALDEEDKADKDDEGVAIPVAVVAVLDSGSSQLAALAPQEQHVAVAISPGAASPPGEPAAAMGLGGGIGIAAYWGVLVAVFYGVMSVSSVFINKAIFSVYKFHYPASLVTGQTLFSLILVGVLRHLRLIKSVRFSVTACKRVGWLSTIFLLKLVLDMSALAIVNIPMYGVLKSSTTPFVLLLDFFMRKKVASLRVRLAVYATSVGGFIAGYGDLTFDMLGYTLALLSALATAAYVVMVGKLGDDLQVDSFTLLMYNCIWSLPMSVMLVLITGEYVRILQFPYLFDSGFMACFLVACASAFVLNLATYLCTLVNDSLTTSIVGRTKSILQGLAGLFAFGDVMVSATNLVGLMVNSAGIGWYAYEKWLEAKAKQAMAGTPEASPLIDKSTRQSYTLTRDSSQLVLSPRMSLLDMQPPRKS
eukprot:jgi/Chlat1/5207/Chrsp33S05046